MTINVAREEFDWIDDAFDDKKTAEEMERTKGPGAVLVLLVLVVIAAVGLVMFALIGLAGALQTL